MRPQVTAPLSLLVVAAPAALAQSLVSEAEVLAYSVGQVAPELAPFEIGGGGALDNPILSEGDLVAFRIRLVDPSITSNATNRAYVYGASRDDLKLLVRSGDPAPGLAGLTLDTGSSAGIPSAFRVSADGLVWFGSRLNGTGVTTADDSAYFGGSPDNPVLWVREGDDAPGTVGAVYASNFGSFSHQSTAFIDAGPTILFKSDLEGGDTTSDNESGWFYGTPGALELIQREADPTVDGTALGSLGFVSQMNSSGQVLLDGTLSTSLGTNPATIANDKAVWIYTPGSGLDLVVREGDTAPGTGGGTFSSPTDFWTFSTGRSCFNENGQWIANLQLQGGDTILDLNDRAIFFGDSAPQFIIVREGDLAPGTDGFFGVFNNTSLSLGAGGQIAFQGSIDGGTQVDETDSGIWYWDGGLTLVMREGDPVPEKPGFVFGSAFGQSMTMNAAGQLLITTPIIESATSMQNSSQIYTYDPELGLRAVVLDGTPVQIDGATTEVASGGSFLGNTNSSGSVLSLNGDGDYTLRANFQSGENAILRGNLGTLAGGPHTLSFAGAPQVHTMNLHAGAANANGIYLMAGSVSGTSPGLPLGAFSVPLNPDAYQTFTVTNANVAPLGDTFGFFDANGDATATFTLSPGANPALSGTQFWHAYVGFNLLGQTTIVSNAATFTLIP